MNEHSGRFVDNDDLVVFENDVELHCFGPHCGAARKVGLDLDEITRAQPITGIYEVAVDLALPGLDQLAQVHLAKVAQIIKKIFAELLLMRRRFDLECQFCDLSVVHGAVRYFVTSAICLGSVRTISGVPLNSSNVPDTTTFLPSSCERSGNFEKSDLCRTAVKAVL